MANTVTFIPPYLGEEIKSNAEKKMYEILQGLEMKQAYVLHSLGLPKHQRKIYGEIDFVVVCERGVACLEIKGGRVECREGRWIFTDRYGVEHAKPEGPFAQVVGNMFSLKEVLKKQFTSNVHMKHLLLASGVVFPDIEFRPTSEEMIPEMIFDKTTSDITAYINGMFDYWQGRQHREPSKLSPRDMKEIVDYLRGEFCFVETLGDRLDVVEQHLVRLTNDQAAVMQALSSNDHLLIEGGAGTGKTLLAMNFAKQKLAEGNRVLYLTFNKNLANHIQRQNADKDMLKVINIHALFGEYVAVDIERIMNSPMEYFAQDLPEECCEYLAGLSTEELESQQYDVLILDEAQDILKSNYMIVLDYLLRGGLEHGKWAVFYDEKQNLYNPEFGEGMELLTSYFNTKFKLFVNCRNTIQIGTYSAKESGNEIGGFLRENGEEVRYLTYADEADFAKVIKETLKELRAEKVPLEQVTFLSPRKYNNSVLAGTGIEVNELGDNFEPKKNVPVYATIQGFKGLDAKVVILFGVDTISKANYAKYIYTAATRARTLLYVVGEE